MTRSVKISSKARQEAATSASGSQDDASCAIHALGDIGPDNAAQAEASAGARAQQEHLAKLLGDAFQKGADENQTPTEKASGPQAKPSRKTYISRTAKTLLALLILVLVALMPSARLLTTTSAEAVVNARIITLRTPIEGEVADISGLRVGAPLVPGQTLVDVQNARADRNRLDDLRREIARLETESKAIGERIAAGMAQQSALADRDAQFRAARIRHLDWRRKQVQAQIKAAEAREAYWERAHSRSARLARLGHASNAAHDSKVRDRSVSKHALAALESELRTIEVEHEAIRIGITLTDSHHDRSQSAERADQLQFQIRKDQIGLAERERRIALLKSDLRAEQELHAKHSKAVLRSPVRGQVWEINTAPGEMVGRAQPLIRILDCGGAVVTASVSEAAYNTLKMGGAAKFKPQGSNTELTGRIIGLSGLAATPANFAIRPSMLKREPYRVTVEVPKLNQAQSCTVGQTGLVTFAGDPQTGMFSKLGQLFTWRS